MKINVVHIIRSHVGTLRNIQTDQISKADLSVFFGVPIIVGVLTLKTGIAIGKDFDSLSITFFGIFIALLLNIQVAMFTIFQRSWTKKTDTLLDEIQQKKLEQRRQLLSELNTNVSYMVTISTFALVFFIALYAIDAKGKAVTALSTVFYVHFLLTLLMIVKRTHALFQGEYDLEAA